MGKAWLRCHALFFTHVCKGTKGQTQTIIFNIHTESVEEGGVAVVGGGGLRYHALYILLMFVQEEKFRETTSFNEYSHRRNTK